MDCTKRPLAPGDDCLHEARVLWLASSIPFHWAIGHHHHQSIKSTVLVQQKSQYGGRHAASSPVGDQHPRPRCQMERRAGAVLMQFSCRGARGCKLSLMPSPWPCSLHCLISPQVVISRQEEGPTIITCYREIHERAKLCALALQRLGVKPGDRVGTLAWNNSRHMESWQALHADLSCTLTCVTVTACMRSTCMTGRRYGIMGSGAICHTLNPRLYAADLEYIINHGTHLLTCEFGTLRCTAAVVRSLLHHSQYYVHYLPRIAPGEGCMLSVGRGSWRQNGIKQ